MKIIGMLSYYQEEPALLYESVSRVCALGVSHVLACDGPYALYPHDVVDSDPECREAIVEACQDGGATYWIVQPHKAFAGNEVEKRNAMLKMVMAPVDGGVSIAECEFDWLLTFDADHLWQRSDHLLVEYLANTNKAVAEVTFGEDLEHPYEARLLMRARDGMHYDGAHWRLRYSNGWTSSTLRAGDDVNQVQALDLREMFAVYHAVYDQPEARRARQTTYYHRRDGQGVES